MILVTGGTGFIGSNLVAGLNARGRYDIVVCDVLGSGEKWRNIAKHEIADLITPDRLNDFLDFHKDQIEMVFHMGANSSTTEPNVDLVVEQNLRASVDIWDRCGRYGIRLIYASSAATYGDGSMGFEDDGSVAGLAALRPLNPYGWSKHAFDRKVARIAETGGPRPPQWSGLKFFNVYGPNEYHKGAMQSVVAQKFPLARDGQAITLFRSHHPDYPDGGQLRDFVYVEDCVSVMLWLFDTPSVKGLFNVGTGQARSFADLATAIFTAVGLAPNLSFIEMPEAIRDRYQYFTQADLNKLVSAGYTKPFHTIEEGVLAYVKDFLATDDPYR